LERRSSAARSSYGCGECGTSQFPLFLFGALWTRTCLILPPLDRLGGNNIGNEGAAAIGEALKHNKTLENLM